MLYKIALILFFLFCVVIFFRMINWEELMDLKDAREGIACSEQVDFIFNHIWDGHEISREAAWYRTVQHLQHGMYPKEMITEAQLRLLLLQRGKANGRRSEYTVNSNGRLVHVTELGGEDDSIAGHPA